MVVIRMIVVMQMTIICSASIKINRRTDNIRIRHEERCTTANLNGFGKCMNTQLCDQAFIHSIRYEDHTSVCQQNAFDRVVCCQPFLDFCANPKNFQIYHGEEANPKMFPYIARLGTYNDKDMIDWRCGASIISQRFLLTAAHCRRMKVAGLGCAASVQCDQQKPIKRFISHPQYKNSLAYHDIAVVELEQKMTFNKYVLPICPNVRTYDLPEDQDLVIAGWGGTERGESSKQLKFGTVRTVQQNDCKSQYASFLQASPNMKLNRGIIDEMYCTQGSLIESEQEYVDACQGDSGGPLVDGQTYLVGVISTGFNCGSRQPGIYTRVASYFDWIKETVIAAEIPYQNVMI